VANQLSPGAGEGAGTEAKQEMLSRSILPRLVVAFYLLQTFLLAPPNNPTLYFGVQHMADAFGLFRHALTTWPTLLNALPLPLHHPQ